MALDLIPFPISLVFIIVFVVACEAVLYKLRKRGKAYSILFKVSLFVVLLLFVSLLFSRI